MTDAPSSTSTEGPANPHAGAASAFARDRTRGAQAFRAGLPYDDRESPGFCLGYGDAIGIEPCDPPADDE